MKTSEESEETPKPISLLPFDYYLIVPDSVPDKLEVLNYNLGEEIYIQFEARDVEKEIHVHGYDLHFMVYPDKENVLELELTIAGEFEIEDHASGYEFARLIVSP
jgi:heme/copper-type cytochrome/quinol oxidase subunit 2